jgi:hypothetical protein
MPRALVVAGASLALAACVPADEAARTGSVEFTFGASRRTHGGLGAEEVLDRWSVTFDRVALGFKTMTIGRIGVEEACAFRGRGARSDVVFDPRRGVVQTFNGLQEVECPDVGVVFGPPGGATTLGEGVDERDLVELAGAEPAHGIVEATVARSFSTFEGGARSLRILLRFDSLRTGSRFGGCRAASRGVRITAGQRDDAPVIFAAENLFRDAISTATSLRVGPFVDADAYGDGNGVVTMAELDAYPLRAIQGGTYQLPDGTRRGSLGDYVRVLFRFTVLFRSENGLCIGNGPTGADGE